MTYQHRTAHQAMTAIAASLALSSTTLLAQGAPPPPGEQAATPATATQASGTAATATAAKVDPGAMPVADPAPTQTAQSQSGFAELDPDLALPLAGAGGLGLLILVGVAAVRRRQRRKREDADEAAKLAFIDANQQRRATEADMAWPPRHDPVPAKTIVAGTPTTKLPNGFDLSRFGPHAQAAYRGPTEDNPSLSLRHRLRRASFLDQQERRAAETAADAPPARIPAKGNWESRTDADLLFHRGGTKTASKPEFQH